MFDIKSSIFIFTVHCDIFSFIFEHFCLQENEHLTKNHTSEEVAGFTEKLDEAESKFIF